MKSKENEKYQKIWKLLIGLEKKIQKFKKEFMQATA